MKKWSCRILVNVIVEAQIKFLKAVVDPVEESFNCHTKGTWKRMKISQKLSCKIKMYFFIYLYNFKIYLKINNFF